MIPTLVTGHLSSNARLVRSGKHHGIKYEIWYDAKPYRKAFSQGDPFLPIPGRPLSLRKPYASVVYYPYMTAEGVRGVEAEQIAWSNSLESAMNKADSYIQRIWRREQDMVKSGYQTSIENPIQMNTKNVLIGVAAVGILGVIAYEMMKPAAAAPPGPGPLPGPSPSPSPSPSPGPITPAPVVLSPNFTVLTAANSGQSVALSLSATDTTTLTPPSAFYLQGTDMPTASVPNVVAITAVPGTATPTWRIAAIANFGVTTVSWTSSGGGAVIVTVAF